MQVSAIGFNIYQYQRNKKLSENTAPVVLAREESRITRVDNTSKNKSPAVKNPVIKDLSKLEENLDATEEELDKVNKQLSEELAKKDAFKEAQAQMQKSITSDPSFRETIKKMRLESIDSDYALLYEHLDLTPEQREEFKRIVGTWRMDDMDTVDLILAATTDEEKEEARRQRQLQKDKYKEQFVELMGEEKYNMYNDFRMSRFDRGTIERFVQTLPPEKRIDNDMMFDLIGRMSKERTALEKKYGFYDHIDFPSDRREDTAEQERQVDMAEQVYKKYIEIGDEMLSPEQAEQYKAYIAQEKESYMSQLKRSFF